MRCVITICRLVCNPIFPHMFTTLHLLTLRSYIHRVPPEMAQRWLDSLLAGVRDAKARKEQEMLWETHGHSKLSYYRARARTCYTSNAFQLITGLLVVFR